MLAKAKCVVCRKEVDMAPEALFVYPVGKLDVALIHLNCKPEFEKMEGTSVYKFHKLDNSDPGHVELYIQIYSDQKLAAHGNK